ncbi:hypothetical protein AAL_05170 [Moelleriella libera RCEF 2490]|uniref:Uncharacterized protein n=1 Tax=Moelleriella libera RCEF 2490 TaxID=1081109 RepID=A0A162IJ30_9HYPO|nr:hypothetical protein AAL_05170 [Moelleriella libera RCEF 2490]
MPQQPRTPPRRTSFVLDMLRHPTPQMEAFGNDLTMSLINAGTPSKKGQRECVICAASAAWSPECELGLEPNDCHLASDLLKYSQEAATMGYAKPDKLARQEVAETEVGDRVQDLCNVLLETSETGYIFTDAQLAEGLNALKQCLATHEDLLYKDSSVHSCCAFLYESRSNLRPLKVDDQMRVAMDVRIVQEVVRLMVRAIKAGSITDLKANALINAGTPSKKGQRERLTIRNLDMAIKEKEIVLMSMSTQLNEQVTSARTRATEADVLRGMDESIWVKFNRWLGDAYPVNLDAKEAKTLDQTLNFTNSVESAEADAFLEQVRRSDLLEQGDTPGNLEEYMTLARILWGWDTLWDCCEILYSAKSELSPVKRHHQQMIARDVRVVRDVVGTMVEAIKANTTFYTGFHETVHPWCHCPVTMSHLEDPEPESEWLVATSYAALMLIESETYVEQGFLSTVICIMDAFTVGIKSRIQVPAKPGKPAQRVNLYDVGKLQSINNYKTPKKQYYAEAVSPLEKVKALGFRHAPAKNPERDTFAVGTALPLTIKDQAKAIGAA